MSAIGDPTKNIPTAKWFLARYFRDVYNRLDLLMATATSLYGTILKVDSTKKVFKVSGVEAESANWVTNYGNERGEIVISVLTAPESTSSLKPMANGPVKRFEIAGVKPAEDW